MQDSLSKFQQFIRQNSLILSVFCFIQLIIIVSVVFFFNTKEDSFKISNVGISNLLDGIKDLPAASIETIESSLYDAIEMNGGILTSGMKEAAKVREGTLTQRYFENKDIYYNYFIVDIEELSQSYQIFHEWSKEKGNPNMMQNLTTMIMCPEENQKIYGTFDCSDKFNHNGARIIINTFINYFNFAYFSVHTKDEENYKIIYINPIAQEVTDDKKHTYINQVKGAIKSLGLPSDLFEYHIMQTGDYTYTIY